MNSVSLMGRLTRDPERRETPQGNLLAKYTLAVRGRNKTIFVPCVAFGKQAEFAEKYLKKGMMIGLCGELYIDSYEASDGTKRTSASVIARDHSFAESKKEELVPDESKGDFMPIDDEDMPF